MPLPGSAYESRVQRCPSYAASLKCSMSAADLFRVQYSLPMGRSRSHQTKLILQALLDAPTNEAYGLQTVRATGVAAGSTYAILRRLEDEGLLGGRWEKIEPASEGRPPRRYYYLTGTGRRIAQQETATERRALRLLMPGWNTA
jgi:PadR family transcriptional regulator PadR